LKAKGKKHKAKMKDASLMARCLHFCPLPFEVCLLPSCLATLAPASFLYISSDAFRVFYVPNAKPFYEN
jgi:hypothetical protein